MRFRPLWLAAALFLAGAQATTLHAQPVAGVQAAAEAQKGPLLETLRELVNIESGSKDREGLAQLAALIQQRLRALGGQVQLIAPGEVYRMDDTPEQPGSMVHAEFKGRGSSKIMLIAHMDTVYLRGMLKDQPFRVDGDRAYGLGILDDKQGIALILHTLALLDKLDYRDYGTLTVLINGDEEISSPASRSVITRLAADQDAVLSFEGGGEQGNLRLATSGIGAAYLKVQGRASHAGSAWSQGVNALTELSHQLLQLSDLTQPAKGLSLNWTVSQAGTNRNVIPAEASASGDARALRLADFDELQAMMQQRIKQQRVPGAKVELRFEMRRPPLEATPASRALGARAVAVYGELGLPLKVLDVPTGGGTDAAFAAVKARGPVLEGLGLSGAGSHSNMAEYVKLDTIVPRLYLTGRLIMDLSGAKAR